MPKDKVLFRVDAGPSIGLGHIQRSLALAKALQTLGVTSIFSAPNNGDTWGRINQSGFALDAAPNTIDWSLKNAEATQNLAIQNECSAIIVDSHRVDSNYLSKLRGSRLFVVLRDDMAAFPFPCQLVINGNADAENLSYISSSGDTEFLLGTQYMVLGPEFRNWQSLADSRPVKNVLVTLGGTDQFNLMPKLLATLDQLPSDITITAIIGPFFSNVDEIKHAASRMVRTTTLAVSPDSLHDRIIEADLAVSAAGQTLYELASAGCPTVAFSVASNQINQMESLAKAGFLKIAGNAETEDISDGVFQSIKVLLNEEGLRLAMASSGRRMVDGEGSLRVANQIFSKGSNSVRVFNSESENKTP